MAAPTLAGNGQTIEMTFSDATTDYVWGTTAGSTAEPSGLKVRSILFDPSGADTMVVRNGSLTGPAIFRVSTADANDQKEIFFDGQRIRPYIEGGDITLVTPASAKLVFNLA